MNKVTLMGIIYFLSIIGAAGLLIGITLFIANHTKRIHEKQLQQENNKDADS